MNKTNDYFKQIKKAALDRKLVFFVGAGISSLSGYPSWKGLIYEFEKGLEGENLPERNYGSDEFLKIPQKYFVEKRKDKYNAILEKFFINDYECNDIHEMMIELNPAHFITTNYDKLIEKACLKKHKLYSRISCDKDVAKAANSSYILKVHGEFSEKIDGKDIILKEEDYIEYDSNYPLTNNLAKSIVATNTVVFIGYGLNDYNINLMLNWVKRIQKNDFNHYFVHVDDQPLKGYEQKYYEKKGMNIIDVSRLIKTDKGEYLKRYQYFMEKLISESKWDTLTNAEASLRYILSKLESISSLVYIRNTDLYNIFDGDYIFHASGRVQKTDKCKHDYFKEYFDHRLEDNGTSKISNLIKSIDKKLKSLRVSDLCEWRASDSDLIKMHQAQNYFKNPLLDNDYSEIDLFLNNRSYELEDMLKRSFYLAGMGEWEESFNLCSQIIGRAYSDENWVIYFIAQLNKYYLSRLIISMNKQLTSSLSYLSFGQIYRVFRVDLVARAEKESKFLTPKVIFEGMPNEFKKTFGFLKWLGDEYSFSVESSELSKLQLSCSKLVMSNSIATGFDNDYNRLARRIDDNIRFCYENCLFVYPSSEFKFMIQISLIPLFENLRKMQKSEKGNNSSIFGDDVVFSKPEFYIDYNEFVQMIKGFGHQDLKKVLMDIKLKEVRFDDMDRVEEYILNTLSRFKYEANQNNGMPVIRYLLVSEEIKNILYLASNLKFTQETLLETVDFILNIAYERDVNIGDKLYYVSKLISNNEVSSGILNIVDEFLYKRFDLRADEKYEENSTRSNIYELLARVVKGKFEDYRHKIISSKFESESYDIYTSKQVNFAFQIIELLSPQAQIALIRIKNEYTLDGLVGLLDLGLLEKLEDYEHVVNNATNKVVNHIKSNIQSGVKTYPAPTIKYAGILYLAGFTRYENIKDYLGYCDEFDMLVDPKSFDFENRLDLNWFRFYSGKTLELIFSNEYLKMKIKPIIRSKIIEESSEDLVRVYIKFLED